MAVPYQNFIVAGIWFVTLGSAVHGGLDLPDSDLVAGLDAFGAANRPFNWSIIAEGLLVPSLLVFANLLLLRLFPKFGYFGLGAVTRLIDRCWGQGSTHSFLQALRLMALVACALILQGAIGLASCVYSGAKPIAVEIASFFLAAGVGFGFARVLAIRLLPGQPWV